MRPAPHAYIKLVISMHVCMRRGRDRAHCHILQTRDRLSWKFYCFQLPRYFKLYSLQKLKTLKLVSRRTYRFHSASLTSIHEERSLYTYDQPYVQKELDLDLALYTDFLAESRAAAALAARQHWLSPLTVHRILIKNKSLDAVDHMFVLVFFFFSCFFVVHFIFMKVC